MVFQNYALYPHMTVFDNMSYGLKIRRMPRGEIEQRVARAAEILELGDLLDRKPRQLSGGQRQRVAMGRAIVREPAVFLFDEPLSNLDAKLRVQMRIEIRKLHEALGITSIYVTHDQVEAMTLGHRLIVMNGGNVEQIGAPLELYDRPDTLFVAEFIGSPSMNVLDARVADASDAVEIAGGGRLPLDGSHARHGGRAVKAGIRPEKLSVAADASEEGMGDLTVELVEPLGADTLVHGRLGDGGPDMTVRLPGGTPMGAGDRLSLAARPADVHLFDPESGRRL